MSPTASVSTGFSSSRAQLPLSSSIESRLIGTTARYWLSRCLCDGPFDLLVTGVSGANLGLGRSKEPIKEGV